MMTLGDRGQTGDDLARIDGAGGVVGIDDDDRPRPGRDELGHLVGIGNEPVLRPAGVVHRLRPVDHHRRRPEGVVGAGDEDLVTGVQQRPHGDHDQFGDAVADEHLVGRHVHHAAGLLLHDHRFAGRKDPLLVRIGVGLMEVLHDRPAHRLRHPEAEGPGVADVELDDLVPGPLELLGPARQGPTNLVLDVVEVFGGAERGEAHGGNTLAGRGKAIGGARPPGGRNLAF